MAAWTTTTILTPTHIFNIPGDLPPLAFTTHALPSGTLHATYAHESHFPHFVSSRGAHKDPRISYFDYSPSYTYSAPAPDGKGKDVLKTVACTARFGRYVLREVCLQPAAGGDTITLFTWRRVMSDFVFPREMPFAGVGPMRRADPKLPKRIYDLEDGSEVFDTEAQKVTLLNGTKYVLEYDVDRIELIEVAHLDDIEGV